MHVLGCYASDPRKMARRRESTTGPRHAEAPLPCDAAGDRARRGPVAEWTRRGPDFIMRLSLEISASLEAQLAAVAARLNVPAEELAIALLRDMLLEPSAEFDAAAARVLATHHALYRRLA